MPLTNRHYALVTTLRRIALIGALAVLVVVTARVGAHVALCRNDRGGSTASGAVEAYYEWCLRRPARGPMQDGHMELSRSYGAWHDVQELSVQYGSSTTKFLFVGQRDVGDRWHVLGGEASGP